MLETRTVAAGKSHTNRSAITNGKRMLPGVDGRSPAARRYRDLVADFARDLGGSLSTAETALIRQAAALTVRSESMQAALLNGEALDDEAVVRLSNSATRILGMLGKQKQRNTKPGRTLAELVAQRKAAAAATEGAT